MLAHRIPYPPHTGDKSRAYHIVRHLAARHDVTLAFLVDDPDDLPGVEALRALVKGPVEFARIWKPWGTVKGVAGLAAGTPLTLGYFGSRGLRERIARRLSDTEYGLIYVSSSAMAQYVAAGTEIPVLMDFVDVDSDKWAQYGEHFRPPAAWVYRAEARRLRGYEADVARWARLCIVTTPAEEALLTSFAPTARTAIIPNGIDLEHHEPIDRMPAQPAVMFTGAMDYQPNIDAVTYFHAEILPRVRREIPETRFYIVGLNPSRRVRRLARTPGVVVTGAVPDVRPYYALASVCVAPLRLARGVQNKVLQAMAMGVPVVATSRACQGLGSQAGQHLHVEDDPAAFAAAVIDLLKDPGERRALGLRGRAFVEAHHSWTTSLERLDTLIAGVAAPGPPATLSAPLPAASTSLGRRRAGASVGETAAR